MLVTGSSGFLGARVVTRLRALGHEVVGVDVVEVPTTTLVADITEPKVPSGVPDAVDCVIHLAAVASPKECERDPRQAFEVNVRGTWNVLSWALARGSSRFVFASSAHCYGISPKYMPTDESHPSFPLDTYTVTKLMGEVACERFYEGHGLSYVSLRLYNGYGPGQGLGYFLPDMIAQARKGGIRLRGGGTSKDFLYVDDMVAAILLAASSSYVGVLNVGSGRKTTLDWVASWIATRLGVPIVKLPGNGAATAMQCDPKRAASVLGWSPSTTLTDGLDRTVQTATEKDASRA